MAEGKKYPGQLVFGLDIGTRSVVGTVGYREGEHFYVVAQKSIEHTTRAMLDGQIHDIGKVGATIAQIKAALELKVERKLTDVCIAAAGRVLKTITVHVEMDFSQEQEVTQEDVFSLDSMGVETAYEEFSKTNQTEEKFYCVGYSVIKYYMNNYPIANLVNHKAKQISADLIATFLPDDVVDGLYRAVELAGLNVANLTLEPIAAIQVAIPEMYRMLNIALIDVGAGTSDICITKDGSIAAYGMIPCAGDALTEVLATHCLVDFVTADTIKRQAGEMDTVNYLDIMLLPQKITSKQVEEVLAPVLTSMAEQAAEKIKELNGGKSVSAVFVIGGGGKFAGYTEKIAECLEIQKERVAIRGQEVMQNITFLEEDVIKDSLLVTPVGICMNFYEHNNNFIYISFNGQKTKLYDNGKLAIVDAAMQAEFPNEGLFPQRGESITFTINGKSRIVRGEMGEPATILRNGKSADLHTEIEANDEIVIKASTKGKEAFIEVMKLPEYDANITVFVNGKKIVLPKFVSVNGVIQSAYYQIADQDEVSMLNYYTVKQIADFMDVTLIENERIYVNNQIAELETVVYDNFSVKWEFGVLAAEDKEIKEEYEEELEEFEELEEIEEAEEVEQTPQRPKAEETMPTREITVVVNKTPVRLNGKAAYIFVDIFDFYPFDLTKQEGKGIVTTVNGRVAQYMEPLTDGDTIEIYWKEQSL